MKIAVHSKYSITSSKQDLVFHSISLCSQSIRVLKARNISHKLGSGCFYDTFSRTTRCREIWLFKTVA
jgi:hypothetical protein